MAFIFIDPKRRKKRKVIKSEESQRVLDALDEYLEGNIDEPVKWLVSFWRDQANVFTYAELLTLVMDEAEPERLFETWFQDYSKLLRERITPMWESAFLAGAGSNPAISNIGFQVNTSETNVRNWILNRGAELVTNVTEDQISAVRYIIAEAQARKMSSAETAKYIRPTVGLTEQQSAANLRHYNSVKEQLRADHPRMTDASIEQKARASAARYAASQHRYRAETIARTEMAKAYNQGNDEAIRQAMTQGKVPIMRKIWSTADDGHVCAACEDLEGTEIDMDGEFKVTVGKKVKHTLTVDIPPLHPRCKCAVTYEETGEYMAPMQNEEEEPADVYEEYDDITDAWRDQYESCAASVSVDQEYHDKDGTIYTVDGVNVRQEHTDHERRVAELLSRATGESVSIVPTVKGMYKHVHTPDYLLGDSKERWDLKDITTANKEAIRNAAHKKKDQADNFIFNVAGNAVAEEVLDQARRAFRQYNMMFVNKIAVIREDEILGVFRRK